MEGGALPHEPLVFSKTKESKWYLSSELGLVALGGRLDLALARVALGGDTGDGVGFLLLQG